VSRRTREQIGLDMPRYSGTAASAKMCEALVSDLLEAGFRVVRQTVPFDKWSAIGDTYLAVNTHRLNACGMIYSPSVSVSGVLEAVGRKQLIGVFDWRHFSVIDDRGCEVAQIVATDSGPAIPLALDPKSANLPTLIIGCEDGNKISELTGDPTRSVRVEISLRTCREKAQLDNIIGSYCLAGANTDGASEVIITAHYDTVYGSPGANDNGSGMLCALKTATILREHMNNGSLPKNTRLVVAFFGGEELLQIGSRHYLAERVADNSLDSIALVLNLDMVGVGEHFWPWVDNKTELTLQQALADLPCAHEVRVLNPPLAGDHYPFYELGLPSSCFIWWPDANYHQAGDVVSMLDESKIEYTARLAAKFVSYHLRNTKHQG